LKSIVYVLILLTSLFASTDKNLITKEVCVNVFNYGGNNLEQLKQILLTKAKKSLLEEELKYNIPIDTIKIKGEPEFYNGDNLGEICIKLTAYLIQKKLKTSIVKENKHNQIMDEERVYDLSYPDYFDNYIWTSDFDIEGHKGKIIMFFLDKKKKFMDIITFDHNNNWDYVYMTVLEGKFNNKTLFYKEKYYQTLYKNAWYWNKLNGIFINDKDQINAIGTFYDLDVDLVLKKTNMRVKDYFDEIWIGEYDTSKFKNGKIILLKNKDIKNYIADLYPIDKQRGTQIFKKVYKNSLIFYNIAGYEPIIGKDYKSFSFRGTMISSKNTFVGRGIKSWVTKIEFTKFK